MADRKSKMSYLASNWLRYFRHLLWNRWAEFNETCLWLYETFSAFFATAERNSSKLCGVFFSGRLENQDSCPVLWLAETFSIFFFANAEKNSIKPDARFQRPLQDLGFLGRLEIPDGRPGLWSAETFFTFPQNPKNGSLRNLTKSKISTSFTKFGFFLPISNPRRPPWPLIGWDMFDFFSETAAGYSRKPDRKQDFYVLYQVCLCKPIRKPRWPSWRLIY